MCKCELPSLRLLGYRLKDKEIHRIDGNYTPRHFTGGEQVK